MTPERVLEAQNDRDDLLALLNRFAERMLTAPERQAVLQVAGVSLAGVNPSGDAFSFAAGLTAGLVGRPISEQGGDHPLTKLLGHFLQAGPEKFGLFEEDAELCQRLVGEIRDRGRALQARRSVGKLEDDQQNGIGTGVLVGPRLLLTCAHVLTKTGVKRAWVRFGYRVRFDGTVAAGDRFELDLDHPVARGGGSWPDYILLRMPGDPKRPSMPLISTEINSGQAVRLIHHPGGGPGVVSESRRVAQVGADYLYHDVPTQEGSSGGPIFDISWKLIALHRGRSDRAPAGLTEGVPLSAFWKELTAHAGAADA